MPMSRPKAELIVSPQSPVSRVPECMVTRNRFGSRLIAAEVRSYWPIPSLLSSCAVVGLYLNSPNSNYCH